MQFMKTYLLCIKYNKRWSLVLAVKCFIHTYIGKYIKKNLSDPYINICNADPCFDYL